MKRKLQKAIKYILNDTFRIPFAAGSVNNTGAYPSGGKRTVVDTTNLLSIAGGKLSFSGGTGSYTGGVSLYEAIQQRIAGKILIVEYTQSTGSGGGVNIGFSTAIDGRVNVHRMAIYVNSLLPTLNGTEQNAGVTISSGVSYKLAFVLRAIGCFYFIKGGTFAEWTLLAIDYSLTTDNLYPRIVNNNSVCTSDFIRIPEEKWMPCPECSDYLSGGGYGKSGASHVQYPTSYDIAAGVAIGNLYALESYDDVCFVVEETPFANPAIDITFNVQLANRFLSHVSFDGYYSGADGESIQVQAYNYITSSWDTMLTMPHRLLDDYYYFNFDSSLHADAGGNTRIRFYREAAGVEGRKLYLDAMYVFYKHLVNGSSADGLAHNEGSSKSYGIGSGGIGRLWQTTQNSYRYNGCRVSPVLSENLITNGTFDSTANWTRSDTTNITISGGTLNFNGSQPGYATVAQNPSLGLSTSQWVKASLAVSSFTSGSIKINTSGDASFCASRGTYIYSGIGQTNPVIQTASSFVGSVDNYTVQTMSLPDLIALVQASTSNVIVSAGLIRGSTAIQLGLALAFDSVTNPQNGILVFVDNGKVKVYKYVNGGASSVTSAPITYVAGGAKLTVIKDGYNYMVMYNGATVISFTGINESTITNNTLFGVFSTDESNQVTNFELRPRGNEGQYRYLDKFIKE